ncbi:MAG: phosphatase PAP2 family protein [Rhodobacteraceae bacterium]|nr:phosphatase PAP2 family protein [Paracoccaceae bacterium]
MAVSETVEGGGALLRVLRRERWLFAIVALHAAATFALAAWLGQPVDYSTAGRLFRLFLRVLPLFLLALLVWRFLWMAVRVRPGRPIHWFLADLGRILLDPERILGGAVAFLLVLVFAVNFTYVKGAIPDLVPFVWDPLFAGIDRWLHGGTDPYRLLLPLLGNAPATAFINAMYHHWLFITYFTVFVACFSAGDMRLRATFLVAFVLVWVIGGNLLATVFSSAGPVFYERLGHGADFEPLMDRLRAINETTRVPALAVQDMLWDGYANGGAAKGISAMPSMHMASTVLLMLYGWACARWAGILLTAFAVVILLGTVHLGYHYAIDSYAGALIALACWKAGAWIAARSEPA